MASSDGSEEWRPVVGFEGWYEVSDMGRVRRAFEHRDWRSRGEARLASTTPIGYLVITLSRRGKITGKSVHSMVMEAFVGPRPPGHETNHKNGDKTDNRLGNLEYVTSSQNKQHGIALGLYKTGAEHPIHKRKAGTPGSCLLKGEDVQAIREAHELGVSAMELGRRWNVSRATIGQIVRRETWRHIP